jgi:putative membrane protein
VVLHLNQFYGFRSWLDGDKLRKRHGLLTVTEGTIPLKKVQALIVKTNPLMRVFGWYELEVQTVGLNVDEQGHRVLVPFAQRDALLAVAQQVRTFDVPTTFDAVSPLTIRRMSVRYTMVLAVAMAIALYFWPVDWWHPYGVAAPWWGGVLIPLLIGWAGLQYRYHGYAVRDDGLYIRRGVLTHHLWVLPTEKFHVFYTTASIFQRRLNLKTLFVDTAGAAAFAYPEVIDVPEAVADDCLERLQTQFRTLYRNRVEAATGSAETRLSADERPQLPSTVSVADDAS